MVRLSHREAESALEFVHAASAADGVEPFPLPVIESFARLVPGESTVYYEWDLRSRGRPVVGVEVPLIATPAHVTEATRHLCSTYPLSILRLSSASEACRLSDFVSLRALHRLEYFDHVLRPFRIEHQVRLWLPAPIGTSRVFYFNRRRADSDFGEHERELLTFLRPFLAAVRERFEFRRAAAPIDGTDLTTRELEILEWVARGKTNKEIAALLTLSANTVRKHLENVYAKLGVHTRTAAVTRTFASRN